MKKYLFMLPMLAVLCFGFMSCSEDDENGGSFDSALIGTWEEKESYDEIFSWEFKSNGKFVWYCTYEGETDVEDSGNFQTNGDQLKLIMTDDGEKFTMTFTYKINGDNLTLYDNEEGDVYECKRVK